MNVSHEMDSNLNISPKMSYGVLECDIVIVTELCAYDFVIKDFIIKKDVICARPCILKTTRTLCDFRQIDK